MAKEHRRLHFSAGGHLHSPHFLFPSTSDVRHRPPHRRLVTRFCAGHPSSDEMNSYFASTAIRLSCNADDVDVLGISTTFVALYQSRRTADMRPCTGKWSYDRCPPECNCNPHPVGAADDLRLMFSGEESMRQRFRRIYEDISSAGVIRQRLMTTGHDNCSAFCAGVRRAFH